MELMIVNRNEITLCGDIVEAPLDTCQKDLGKLWGIRLVGYLCKRY